MSLAHWIAATRPRTLPAGIVPVAAGAALAGTVTTLHWPSLIACAVGGLLIQIGTNFANDAFDALKGADTAERVGPTRAVASGLISPRAMLIATAVVLLIALGIGIYLGLHAGWWLFALGVVSLVCAVAYTGGPFPLAYHGLGDVFVFVFFGLFAVLGTAWTQVAPTGIEGAPLGLPLWWWLVAAALGLQATAILAVNNLRDIPTDAAAGKRTLAVRLGATLTRWYNLGLHLVAGACYGIAALLAAQPWLALPSAVALLAGGVIAWRVFQEEGPALNRQLARSALVELISGLSVVVVCIVTST